MKSERANRFISACRAAGLGNAEIASLAGVAGSSITTYRKGIVPKADNALAICRVLNITLEWWIEGRENLSEDNDVYFLPIRGGNETDAIAYAKNLIDGLRLNPSALFCLFAQGNMMSPTIPEFAEVICTSEVSPLKDGRIYLVRVGESEFLRRIRILMDGRIQVLCDHISAQNNQLEYISVNDVVAEVIWVSHRPL